MTRKRYKKLLRAFLTKKYVEGKQWYDEPIGKTYKRIRDVKVDWNKCVNPLRYDMMYSCSLYFRDYGTCFDIDYLLERA